MRGLALTCLVGALLVALLALLDQLFPPPLHALASRGGTIVVAADGSPLRAFADARGVWRYDVDLEAVSPRYVEALLAYEDRWFFRHPGVSPVALLRATGQTIWHQRFVSGGSTLSMQVARLAENLPHTLSGKFWQILRALQIERRLSKREILRLYINHAPFGGNIEGVQAASFAYFGKSADRLSHAEAALLVVLPQAPSRLRPDRHAARAERARNKVLRRLADLGVWSRDTTESSMIERVDARRLRAPALAALLARRVASADPIAARIQTTIDPNWQRRAEARVSSAITRFPAQTSAAALVVDGRSGAVLAYVGSAKFGDPERLGHVDMVRAVRSPGSTLKPFIYGLSLDAGLIHSASLLVDAPTDFDGYAPGNFGDQFFGPVTAATALQRSLNVPAVALLRALGPPRLVTALDHIGLRLRLPTAAKPNLALALGGAGTTLEQLVQAYTALSNDGLAMPLHWRADQAESPRRLLSPGAAFIVRQMLAGTPQDADLPFAAIDPSSRLAFKTGTSYGFRDALAIGIADDLVIGVWIGRPDGTPVPGSYGAVSALPLLMELAHTRPRLRQRREPPTSVSEVEICWPTGTRRSELAPNLCRRVEKAQLLDDTAPRTLPDPYRPDIDGAIGTYWVDRQGQRRLPSCLTPDSEPIRTARWPLLALPWLSQTEQRAALWPPLAAACRIATTPSAALLLSGIREGAVLRPAGSDPVTARVRVIGATGRARWLLNGRLLPASARRESVLLTLDQRDAYTLTALDDNGRYATVRFRVD